MEDFRIIKISHFSTKIKSSKEYYLAKIGKIMKRGQTTGG